MNIRMEKMRDLAHYFGRTAFQKEIANQYEAIINGWSQGLFENVINYIRESEHITDFPKPFEMDRIGKKLYSGEYHEYEDCKYCDKTGFISRVEYPPDADGRAYTFSYICKCSSGTVMKCPPGFGVPYFSKFDYDNDDGLVVKHGELMMHHYKHKERKQ